MELILRFDVNLETFTNVGLPSFPYESGLHGALVNVDDQLHLFAIYYRSFNYSVDMWKMDCEQWIKLFYVPHAEFILVSPNFCVIHVKSTAVLLMMTEWGDVCEFDMEKKTFAYSFPNKYFNASYGSMYSESLLSPCS